MMRLMNGNCTLARDACHRAAAAAAATLQYRKAGPWEKSGLRIADEHTFAVCEHPNMKLRRTG